MKDHEFIYQKLITWSFCFFLALSSAWTCSTVRLSWYERTWHIFPAIPRKFYLALLNSKHASRHRWRKKYFLCQTHHSFVNNGSFCQYIFLRKRPKNRDIYMGKSLSIKVKSLPSLNQLTPYHTIYLPRFSWNNTCLVIKKMIINIVKQIKKLNFKNNKWMLEYFKKLFCPPQKRRMTTRK